MLYIVVLARGRQKYFKLNLLENILCSRYSCFERRKIKQIAFSQYSTIQYSWLGNCRKKDEIVKMNIINGKSGLLIILFWMNIAASTFAQDPFNLNFRRGYYYLDIDNVKAIKFFDNAIVIDSTKAVAFYYRGIAHFKNQEPTKSINDFDKAMQIDSGFYRLHIFKAFVYRSINKMDLAIESFSRYIEKDLNDTIDFSYFVRGRMKGDIGNYKGAIEDFDKAISQNPSQENYYYYLFISKYKTNDFSGALEEIDKIISFNPSFYGYHFYRGNVNYLLGNFGESIEDYNTTITLNSNSADAYYRRGMANDTLNIVNLAMQDYTLAINLKPEDALFYSRRGNLKYKMGNKEGACLDWTVAGELGFYADFDKMKRLCD